MKLKRHTRYTKYGSSIGFTRVDQLGAITGGIDACPSVSWMARICYRFGWIKAARCV